MVLNSLLSINPRNNTLKLAKNNEFLKFLISGNGINKWGGRRVKCGTGLELHSLKANQVK